MWKLLHVYACSLSICNHADAKTKWVTSNSTESESSQEIHWNGSAVFAAFVSMRMEMKSITPTEAASGCENDKQEARYTFVRGTQKFMIRPDPKKT